MPDEDLTFKKKFIAEKDKVKKMNFKHKMSYFKSYYLGPVIAVVGALVIIGLIIYDTQIANIRVYYSGVLIAVDANEETIKYMSEEFDEVATHSRKEQAFLYDELYIPQSEDRTRVDGLDYVDLALAESVASGEFNYFLIDEDMIDHYDSMNFFNDISDLAQIYEIPENDRYIGHDGEVVAVKLNDDICDRLGLKAWDVAVYYAQIHSSDDPSNDKLFWDRLFRITD